MRIGRMLAMLAGAAIVPAVAGAQTYDEPQPAPQTQQTPAPPPPPVTMYTGDSDVVYDRVNAPVFTTGALVFGISYGAAVITAASTDHPGADRLYVPVAGPWLALSDWGNCPISEPRCDRTTTDKVLLVADGVFQAASLIAMLDALLDPGYHHTTIVRTAHHLAPTSNGIAAFGRF